MLQTSALLGLPCLSQATACKYTLTPPPASLSASGPAHGSFLLKAFSFPSLYCSLGGVANIKWHSSLKMSALSSADFTEDAA